MIMRSKRRATETPTGRAKLFRNGRSQAVRLPKDFRFPGDEVLVHREGDAVILEPVKVNKWPRGYWDRLQLMKMDYEIEPMRIDLGDVDLDER